jgi:serine/threonine protein kinase
LLDPIQIGSGGFADVFRASDIREAESGANPVVAIKVLRDLKDDEIRRRFQRELRLIGQCRHPNIVPILDDGEDENGVIWYAMPLAKGSLADEADRFVGKDQDIIQVMRQLCAGMAYVHKKGIYHRDLKPANVLRLATDAWAISDFGLAREAERTTTALTSTLQGVGTYFYAAPEVWKGAKYAEIPADTFGLGKILHQLVTGELPIDRDGVEGRFRSVIRKATRPRAEDRYQSAEEMDEALNVTATAQDRWASVSDIAESLRDRIAADNADDSALDDLMELAQADGGNGLVELRETIPLMSPSAISRQWERDPDAFRVLMERYSDHVATTSWPFSFCDKIADFFERAVKLTGDDDVLQYSIYALVEMGRDHNRWHVRDVFADILQRIRTPNSAIAAAEGLKAASSSAVAWSISEFVGNSLHPIIREVVLNAHRQNDLEEN